jgi:hypothetical protein
MFPRSFRPLAYLLICGLALSLAAAPAQAYSPFQGQHKQARASKPEKERGLFFSWLAKWFGKSGGGMDPNGTEPER